MLWSKSHIPTSKNIFKKNTLPDTIRPWWITCPQAGFNFNDNLASFEADPRSVSWRGTGPRRFFDSDGCVFFAKKIGVVRSLTDSRELNCVVPHSNAKTPANHPKKTHDHHHALCSNINVANGCSSIDWLL